MQYTRRFYWRFVALGTFVAALGAPAAADAQAVAGHGRAVEARVLSLLGTQTTVLADTGTLGHAGDARDASQSAGSVAGLLQAGTLHAATIAGGDQVGSEASLADLAVNVAGTTIGADFVMSRARAVQGVGSGGVVDISGLAVNGLPISVTGQPNQTIAIPGGRVVINEQQVSANGIVVNALHIIVSGVADVVVASASAGIQ